MDPDLPAEPSPGDAAGLTPREMRREDLAGGLADLAGLSSSRLSLEDLLTEVASLAVRAIPGADGAGLTLQESDRPDTVVQSGDFVGRIDDIQYGIGEGPCITAVATGQTMRSGSLDTDPRWPRFGARISGLGVHSVLSLPLLAAEQIVGSINVYARPRDAFDSGAQRIGQLFAGPAAIAAQNAQLLAQTQRLATNLQTALTTRAVIDQAIGIIISRTGNTPDEAFQRIRAVSRTEHRKLAAVAATIVEEATRRARRPKGNA